MKGNMKGIIIYDWKELPNATEQMHNIAKEMIEEICNISKERPLHFYFVFTSSDSYAVVYSDKKMTPVEAQQYFDKERG